MIPKSLWSGVDYKADLGYAQYDLGEVNKVNDNEPVHDLKLGTVRCVGH